MKHDFQKFTCHFYAYCFLCDFALIYAVYVLLFNKRGLTTFEISALLALWSLFVVIFEVPAGALADKWSRKQLIAVGMLFKSLGFGIWYFAHNFFLFALGFLFWGIQESFASGAQEALLYDTLKTFNRTADYEKITGKGHFYSKIAVGIALLIGGFLASFDFYDGIILISAMTMALAVIPVIHFPGDSPHEKKKSNLSYLQIIKAAFHESRTNRTILRLLIYLAVIVCIILTIEEYVQLYFNWIELPVFLFGVGLVFIIIMEAFGNRIAYKFEKIFSCKSDLEYLGLFSGVCLFISAIFRTIWMIPVLAVIFFIVAIIEVLVESRMQREIRSEQRATVMSMRSLIMNGSVIPLLMIFGIISNAPRNLSWGFGAFGLIMIVFSAGTLFIYRRLNIMAVNKSG